MHFLLELFQNADDNLYEANTIPKMKITFRDSTLRFDSNEMGFRKRDVESICSVNQSSKSESHVGVRRIGEKGVGFKSVFKVADSVFIASGPYTFMFTAKERLGRLAPVWVKFPEKRLAGFTSILLQLGPTLGPDILAQCLKGLDGRLLFFLQKLKEVEVEVFENNQTSSTILRRKDNMSTYGLPSRTLEPDNFSPYILFKFPVYNLPFEKKRKNLTSSEIVLAFPSDYSHASTQPSKLPIPGTHKVYAFLPIRDYGFKVRY